jgi:hypothetical protein
MMNPDLARQEAEFDLWMQWISEQCFERFGYRPTRFAALVAELRGVGAAKRLLAMDKDGVAWEELRASRNNSFEITMEYLVVQERYRELFSPAELAKAEERLAWFPEERINHDRYRAPYDLATEP